MLHELIGRFLLVTLIISSIPLIATSVVGLIVAVLQSATQIQEQTTAFVAKLCACIAACVVMWGAMSKWFDDLFQLSIQVLAAVGRS